MDNLFEMLLGRTGAPPTTFHHWRDDRYVAKPWADVARDAVAMTAGLRALGVRPGERVASVLTNDESVVTGLLAAWLAGGAVASLPVPARGMGLDEYGEQLIGICEQLDPVVFLIEERLAGLIPEALSERVPVRTWESLRDSGAVDLSPPGDDDLAFIQYSSGSTSAPKGCMLTPRAITAQIDLIYDLFEGRPGQDVSVSWLPLSHDMGMFGCLLTPWARGGDLFLSSPERFMMSPRTWFQDLADYGGHNTAGTPTALHIAARMSRGRKLSRPLEVKACIIGAERVEFGAIESALEVFGPHGLLPHALCPAYGLAEATLCVTATPLRESAKSITVDAVALADSQLVEVDPDDPTATRLVSAGVPQKGVTLPGAPSDVVGELSVASPCLSTGYYADPDRTEERFVDGTFRTGDLGFVRDGHFFPVGRVDDLISISGRKVYAREIENAVDGIPGIRRGCSTLIDQREAMTSRLTLFVEVREDGDYRRLAEEAASIAMTKAAVTLDECVFLPKDSLPKTPSGKIQRHRCRAMVHAGRFEPLASISLKG